jgi:hypothetical protein
MDEDRWWAAGNYDIVDIENNESSITILAARETDRGWEYAIVFWRYQQPTLKYLFCNGELLFDCD